MEDLLKAIKVIETLENNQHQAYFVGGCVRDYFLKRAYEDIDITTSAKPFEVMKYFKTVPTGLKYGTVTILFEDAQFEVTTFRLDGKHTDFRHPDSVVYTLSEIDDVNRRDFTINGLLMDKRRKIIDHVGGLEDIKNKIVRSIGDPQARFKEDALRILRAFYFCSKLGFDLEENTAQAAGQDKDLLDLVSGERILTETIKIIKGQHALQALKLLVKTNVHTKLPGLKNGIEFISNLDKMPYVDTFFVMCFILNKGIVPSSWRFSNMQRHKYQLATKLAVDSKVITHQHLYEYGLENCLLANKALAFLGQTKFFEKGIMQLYETMPIKSELDIALSSMEMIAVADRKPAAWLANFKKDCAKKILNKEIVNDKESVTNYLKQFLQGK